MGGGGVRRDVGRVLNSFRELGKMLYYFKGSWEHSQNNFREH